MNEIFYLKNCILLDIGQALVKLYNKHFQLDYYLFCEDWKLVPGPFMILIKWQYNAAY